ncbi:hypothetical protein HZA42_02415 [Candidatus Peregrinibacteria bacterium]|nr:hypothetical protein [Candidatus Peregrinibacteria bacterium]
MAQTEREEVPQGADQPVASPNAQAPAVSDLLATIRARAVEPSTGRDFLEACKDPACNRELELTPGDYIDMPAETFRSWPSSEMIGDEKALSGGVRVKLSQVVYDGVTVKCLRIVVEAGGVKKRIEDPSLFYNYYRRAGEHMS